MPKCTCKVPAVTTTNAGLDMTPCAGKAVGETCAFRCKAGYYMSTPTNYTNSTCQSTGAFANVPACALVTCPAIEAPYAPVTAGTCTALTGNSKCSVRCAGTLSNTVTSTAAACSAVAGQGRLGYVS